jgi:hypothetical protein
MSDRCQANKAALAQIEKEWEKSLNQLFCHVHPIDSITSSCRSALKGLEKEKGKVFGSDCIAANLAVAVSIKFLG